MKILSLVLAFCFSSNLLANPGNVQSLENALNNYQYAMTVEWDQKDSQFAHAQNQILIEKLTQLLQDKQLSTNEMLSFVQAKSLRPEVLEVLELKLALRNEINSSEELAQFLKESADSLYQKGASWNGEVIYLGALGLIFILAAVIGYNSYLLEKNNECVAWETRYSCWGVDSYCGYSDVCTDWVPKQ